MFRSSFRRMMLLALMMLLGAVRVEGQEWKTKWDKVLADAKKEGKSRWPVRRAPPTVTL